MKVTGISFKKPIDFHCHFRQGELLKHLVLESVKYFRKALAMPNTIPPILTPEDVLRYKEELQTASRRRIFKLNFDFLLTFKIVESTSPDTIAALKSAGAIAGKLYPGGVTTNSEDGVKDFKSLYPVFSEMERLELVLCVHAEMPGSPIETAEADFLPILQDIIDNFPKLRIVFEHVSTAAGVEFVKRGKVPTLGATVTPHHLLLTKEDVFKDGIIHNPHHFCKPVCKTAADRQAIRNVVLHECHPSFFLGTDSAPHPETDKQKDPPNAGVYNVSTAIPLLLEEFMMADSLQEFEGFTSAFGERFYGLGFHEDMVEYQRWNHYFVQDFWEPYSGSMHRDRVRIKPLGAGQELTWLPKKEW